jgi:hypothetical protein
MRALIERLERECEDNEGSVWRSAATGKIVREEGPLSYAPAGGNVVRTKDVFGNDHVRMLGEPRGKEAKWYQEEVVDARNLIPSQPTVFVSGLERYHPQRGNLPAELAGAVRLPDGRMILMNHTRIAAQVLAGRRYVRVRMFEMDEDGKFRKLAKK